MSRRLFARLLLPLLLAWGAAAWLAWHNIAPGDVLVGARAVPRAALHADDFAVADLAAARARLAEIALWGVRRDGSPLDTPGKGKTAAEAAQVEWELLAVVRRASARAIIVRIDRKEIQLIEEGRALPDGGKLVEVGKNFVVVTDGSGAARKIVTHAD